MLHRFRTSLPVGSYHTPCFGGTQLYGYRIPSQTQGNQNLICARPSLAVAECRVQRQRLSAAKLAGRLGSKLVLEAGAGVLETQTTLYYSGLLYCMIQYKSCYIMLYYSIIYYIIKYKTIQNCTILDYTSLYCRIRRKRQTGSGDEPTRLMEDSRVFLKGSCVVAPAFADIGSKHLQLLEFPKPPQVPN